MRLVCHVLETGEREIYTTSDNGLRILEVFEGQPQVRHKKLKRVTVFIEVGYANNDLGLKQAREALEKLQMVLPAPPA